MSGFPTRRTMRPVEAPLLDRLMDDEPGSDRARSPAETVARLRRSVHRDVEALLNARRPWRSPPPALTALRLSPLAYGMPDFTAGAFNDRRQREVLRAEIEETIRRFEPRLTQIQVRLIDQSPSVGPLLRTTLQLRIEALLRAQPAPEPIVFDTAVDTTTADVVLNPLSGL